MILIVDKRESVLKHRAGAILIERPGEKRQSVPLEQLEQVIVYGNPSVETAVWRMLAAKGISTTLLPLRGRSEPVVLGASLATRLPLRKAQHRCADRMASVVSVARWLVAGKLHSYHPLLQERAENGEVSDLHARFGEYCDRALEKLEQTSDLETIRGIEGGMAREWFSLLAEWLPSEMKFGGRNRRPPRDPVNALLSLGYTLLYSEMRQLVVASGFDPSMGFLHREYPGRESFVLDCCERFRCGVDRLVLDLVGGEVLQSDDFYYRKEEGCRLAKKGRPLFYDAWAAHLRRWPDPERTGDDASPPQSLRQRIGQHLSQLREQILQAVDDG